MIHPRIDVMMVVYNVINPTYDVMMVVYNVIHPTFDVMTVGCNEVHPAIVMTVVRRDVPVGGPLDLCTPTVMEWHELPKYNGIQVSQLI